MTEIADRLVVIATFQEANRAHIVRARLESEGVRAVLDGEHHVTMDWFISNAVGGVKVMAHERDREAALRILNETATEMDAIEVGDASDGDADQALCPSCGSQEIYSEKIRRLPVFLSLILLGLPLPFLSRRMACDECDNRWKPGA